jgi:RND family efflux transporter MFP subunit
MMESPRDFEKIPLWSDKGRKTVYVGDVAEVVDGQRWRTNTVRVDGRRAVYMPLLRQAGASAVTVIDSVQEFLPELYQRGVVPEDVEVEVVFDQSQYVREAIGNLRLEALLGAGLASLVVLLFLGSLRATWIVALSIPLAILGAFIGLYFSGHTLNIMTLGGLALMLGRVIDDSIVAVENTVRHLGMAKSAAQAAQDGAAEISVPALLTKLTTIIVFFPITFMEGMGKHLFWPLAFSAALVLLTSFIVARTVSPLFCARHLRPHGQPERFPWPLLVAGLVLAALGLGVWLTARLASLPLERMGPGLRGTLVRCYRLAVAAGAGGPGRVKAGETLLRLAVPVLEAQKRQKEALLEQTRNQKLQTEEMRQVAAKELAEAEKQEKRFLADLKARRLEHERVTELVRRGLEAADCAWQSARAAIETRQARLKAVEADLRVAQSRIDVAEAEVHNLSVLVGYATITAPFSGVITRRSVDRGATIKDPATPLLTLQRIDQVRVLLDISERDVPLVNAVEHHPNSDGTGDPVTLRIAALADQGPHQGVFHGQVTRMASALDPASRTMRTEVHLDNPDEVLQPGMFGVATLLLEERYALTIPASALVRRGGKTLVCHVADASGEPPRGVVREAEVALGLDDGKRVEVRSGLTGKELVIVKGNGVVRPGEKAIAVSAEP